MKRSQTTIAFLLITAALLAVTGCKRHKPDLPPQSQAPTVSEQPAQPAPPPDNSASAPTNTTPPPPVKPPKTTTRTPRPAPRKPAPAAEKPQAPEVAKVILPPRIVIQQGGANDASGSAPITPLQAHDDAAHSQASTAQLMDSTKTNLAGIKRQLSADEQSVVSQIHDYMSQSQQATKDGDQVRARNLALKAHLLSDELAKTK